MRRIATAAALALALAASASAQERPAPGSMMDAVKPPPAAPRPDVGVAQIAATPPARTLSEEDVEAIVARVIARSAPRQAQAGPGYPPPPAASSQYQGPVAMPMPMPSAQSYAAAPAQTVAVLVPAGPISSAAARLGHKMARLGAPRVKTFRVASAAAYAPVATQAPVYATGQQ